MAKAAEECAVFSEKCGMAGVGVAVSRAFRALSITSKRHISDEMSDERLHSYVSWLCAPRRISAAINRQSG